MIVKEYKNTDKNMPFVILATMLLVLSFTACNKQNNDVNNDANNADNKSKTEKALQCLVYQAKSNGELINVTKDCSSLQNISVLAGKTAEFVHSDASKYQKPLVRFNKTKNHVEFLGDRSKKLAGIYLRMDQAKKFLLDAGLTEADNYKAKLIYPFSLGGEEIGVLWKIAYSTALDAIVIPLISDNNLAEPALGKGLSMQAYFHSIMEQMFPDQSINPENQENSKEKHNTWTVVIYGFALYFGAAIDGNIDYLEELGATTKWTPYNPPIIEKEMFLPLTNLTHDEFDPLPYSANIAHCLWKARTTIGLKHQKYFDMELITYLKRDDTPLTSKDGIVFPDFLNNLSRRMSPGPRKQFCPCIVKQFNHAAKYVGACTQWSQEATEQESRKTETK